MKGRGRMGWNGMRDDGGEEEKMTMMTRNVCLQREERVSRFLAQLARMDDETAIGTEAEPANSVTGLYPFDLERIQSHSLVLSQSEPSLFPPQLSFVALLRAAKAAGFSEPLPTAQ